MFFATIIAISLVMFNFSARKLLSIQYVSNKIRYNFSAKYPLLMKNLLCILICSAFILGAISACKSGKKDWNSPATIYNHLCACKNKDGQRIDDAWKVLLIEKKVAAHSPDEIIKAIGSNTNMLLEMIDSLFLNDQVYLSALKTANDTLVKHGAKMEFKGQFAELFSVRSKYPACVSSINYILQR